MVYIVLRNKSGPVIVAATEILKKSFNNRFDPQYKVIDSIYGPYKKYILLRVTLFPSENNYLVISGNCIIKQTFIYGF